MPRTDVAILGGGIIGCALAEELARAGRRVVLLERGRLGAEASSAAAGILLAQLDLTRPDALFALCQASRRLYPRWVVRLERRAGLSVGYRANGALYLALTASEEARMARRMRWQRRRGLQVERWSSDQVRRREPQVDGRIRCGFWFPTEARVDNVRLLRALARACRRAGVTVQERTRVRRVLVRGRAVRGVQTNRGTLMARVVVNCLGSWAAMDGRFPVRLPVRPARGQLLAFRGPPGLLRRTVISEGGYLVQHHDHHVLVGSTIELVGFHKALTAKGVRGILSGVQRLSSALGRCTLLDAWAGFRPYTRDQRPIIGRTRIDGLYVATGHFRHGILLAPITAKLLTELILRGRASLDLTPFSIRDRH